MSVRVSSERIRRETTVRLGYMIIYLIYICVYSVHSWYLVDLHLTSFFFLRFLFLIMYIM